jgi:hypothetical protein
MIDVCQESCCVRYRTIPDKSFQETTLEVLRMYGYILRRATLSFTSKLDFHLLIEYQRLSGHKTWWHVASITQRLHCLQECLRCLNRVPRCILASRSGSAWDSQGLASLHDVLPLSATPKGQTWAQTWSTAQILTFIESRTTQGVVLSEAEVLANVSGALVEGVVCGIVEPFFRSNRRSSSLPALGEYEAQLLSVSAHRVSH